MSFTKDGFKDQIKKIYGPTILSKEDAFAQWNIGLTEHLRQANFNGFNPSSFGKDLSALFAASASSETFIADFGSNLETWAKGVSASNGKDTKAAVTPEKLDFAAFSKEHEQDTDIEKYQDDLAVYLHNWFSKITF